MAKMTFTATATTTRTGKGLLKGLVQARPNSPAYDSQSAKDFDLDIRSLVKQTAAANQAAPKPPPAPAKPVEEEPQETESVSKKKRRRRKKKAGANAGGESNPQPDASCAKPAPAVATSPVAPPAAMASKDQAKPAANCAIKEDVGKGKAKGGKPTVATAKAGAKPTPAIPSSLTDLVARTGGKNAQANKAGGKKESWPEIEKLDLETGTEEDAGKGKKLKKQV